MAHRWNRPAPRELTAAARSAAVLLLVSLLLAAGCGDDVFRQEPDLTGRITSIGRAVGNQAVQILVEERPGVHDGSGKAYVFILADRAVFERVKDEYRRSSTGDLGEGMLVHVWFDGPVQESYPLQGTARAVAIIPSEEPTR